MTDYLKNFADEQIKRIRATASVELLADKAAASVSEALEKVVSAVSESTMRKMLTDEIALTNPLAAMSFELTLKEERERAEKVINGRLASGESALPSPMPGLLRIRLTSVGDAVIEMLERMTAHRDEICAALTGGRLYTRIEDITLSAGDTHNHGRSVMILHTDAGRLVYKPHDMRGEAFVYELAERFFDGVVGIPRCAAFSDEFGVCEYISKIDGAQAAILLNIEFFKQIAGGEVESIHSLNGDITITVQLPDGIINTNDNIERTFYVVRIHEGAVELIECTYNAADNTITFYTDRFSAYVIGFVDVDLTEGTIDADDDDDDDDDTDIEIDDGIIEPTEKPAQEAAGETNPHTGAELPSLAVLAISAAAALTFRKRSK